MGKIHKTIRIENDLMERINGLTVEGESTSKAINRVLLAGCEALECGTFGSTESGTNAPDVAQASTPDSASTRRAQGVAQASTDASTQRLIDYLEREIERLEAEHVKDREAITQKDEQLARALENAHDLARQAQELTHQAHVLTGMEKQPEALPVATAQAESTEESGQAGEQTQPEEHKSWFARWFG